VVSTPHAPDPTTTAAAQSGLNTDTAETQLLLNQTNQVGPWGSTTYKQTGTTGYTNSAGKYVTLPQYTATTEYSPGQQAILDKTQDAQANIADIAAQQSKSLEGYLNTGFNFDNGQQFNPGTSVQTPGQFSYSSQANPGTFNYQGSTPGQFNYDGQAGSFSYNGQQPGSFSYGSQAPSAQTVTPKDFSYTGSDAQNQAYDLASQRILPQQQKATAALQTQLANQGIQPGSAAWNNAINLNNQSNNDQLNQLALNGEQQFYGQALSTAQNNYGQQLGAANQNFNQQLASQQANSGQELNAYQANLAGQNQGFNQQLGGFNANLAAQNQNYTQALGGYSANLAGQNQGYNQQLGTYGANTQAQLAAQQQNAGQELSAYQANLNGGLSAEQAAYQQALSTRQQQYQEALGNRNQPINEITALLSGSQVSNPTGGYTNTPQAQVGGVDYTGLVNNQYNQQVASSNATLGGLFGLGGQLGSAGIKAGLFG
jgi:hypothetical protein